MATTPQKTAPPKPDPKAPTASAKSGTSGVVPGDKSAKAQAAKANPKCAVMVALAGRPMGADVRTLALAAGKPDKLSEVMAELNALCYAGYVRRVGGAYQPTPKGTTEALAIPKAEAEKAAGKHAETESKPDPRG